MPTLPPFVADFRLYPFKGQMEKPGADVTFDLSGDYSESNFLALPIQRLSNATKKFQKAKRRITILRGNGGIGSIYHDTLEHYISIVGKFFGADPDVWELAGGEKQVEEFEEDGFRVKRVTGTFKGVDLTLYYVNQFFDPRLAITEEVKAAMEAAGQDVPEGYDKQTMVVDSDKTWQKLVQDQPWSPAKRRKVTSEFLVAKMNHGTDPAQGGPTEDTAALQLEGAHGMWEMVANKAHHAGMDIQLLLPLVMLFEEKFDVKVNVIATSAVWAVSVNQHLRRELAKNECIEQLLISLMRTLKAKVVPEGTEQVEKGSMLIGDREELQFKVLGALGVSAVDRVCRRHLIEEQPTLQLLFQCTKNLEGYRPFWEGKRRYMASQILCNVLIRDAAIRKLVVVNGGFKMVLDMLIADGPESLEINRCGAAILQAFGSDDPAMLEVAQRGLLSNMLEACVLAVAKYVKMVEEQTTWQDFKELEMLLNTFASCANALWGAAYWAQREDKFNKAKDEAELLTQIAVRVKNVDDKVFHFHVGSDYELDTIHISYSLSSALACYSMDLGCAEYMCGGGDLNSPAEPVDNISQIIDPEPASYDPDGRVRAASLTALAYLSAHPMDKRDQGEEAFHGFYRAKLIAYQVYGKVLHSMIAPAENPESARVILDCGATAIMFLSTSVKAPDIDTWMVHDLLHFNKVADEMDSAGGAEHLMVSFWLLLRDPEIRLKLRDVEDPTVKKVRRPTVLELMQPKKEEPKEDEEKKDGEEEAVPEDGAPIIEEEPPKLEYVLDNLVGSAESWYDRVAAASSLAEGKPGVQAPEAALIKMFEFLANALWLYLMAPHGPIPKRRRNVSELDHPKGVVEETWWGVTLPQPSFSIDNQPSVLRSLKLLGRMLELPNRAHQKIMQIANGCLWSYSALNRAVEVHLVAEGVCSRLLAVVEEKEHPWGPGLIEATASHYAYLADEYRNHGPFLTEAMNERFITAMVRHIDSPYPRAQAAAMRVLGHMSFIAPLGRPNAKKYVASQKDLMMKNKVADVLSRYLMRKFKLFLEGMEDPVGLEADHENEEEVDTPPLEDIGVLACIAHGLRILRNISVAVKHQVYLAKVAVMTTLKISSHFTGLHIAGGAMPEETDVANLANGIIQNMAAHPDNRTRFYKIELQGTTAAQVPGMGQYGPMSPRSSMSMSPERAERYTPRSPRSPEGPAKHPPGMKLPGLPGSPTGPATLPVQNALSTTRSSVSSLRFSTPSTPIRPKVKFPAVRPATSAASSAGGKLKDGTGAKALSKEKQQFLSWMKSTFQEAQDTHEAIQRITACSPHLPKRLVTDPDEALTYVPEITGKVGAEEEWSKYDDKSARPHLQRNLRRPLSHMWHQSEESLSVEGQKRWCPAISEYQEPEETPQDAKAPAVVKKLLTTKHPQHATRDLTEAIEKIHAAGKGRGEEWRPAVDPALGGDTRIPEAVVLTRPSTGSRNTGRMALTMLAPTTVDPYGVPKEQDLMEDPAAAAQQEMALRVAVAPQRGRTRITFKEQLKEPGPRNARLAVFEHVKGSQVYKGLYDSYQLPNGTEAFYYYHAGGMVDEVEVELLDPPARPDNLHNALQKGLPMGVDMDLVTHCPGPATMHLPLYKPAPPLCPLPSKHTLRVKDESNLGVEGFADLKEDNIFFVVALTHKMRKDTQVTKTKIEVVRVRTPTPRPPWKLPQSIFRARLKECESKAFFDVQKVQNKHFEVEWKSLTDKEKIVGVLTRENKASPKKLDDAAFMKALKATMHKHFPTVCSVFNYYSSQGSGSPFFMQLNAYSTFLDDCTIPDAESQFCKRSDCDTTFIVSNYEQEKKSEFSKINEDHGLMKFELMEAILRLAISKYGKGIKTADVIEAVDMMFETDIIPNLPPMALIDKNDFCRNRLYCEEVDDLYKANEKLLRAIYSRYRLPPRSGGVRNKMLCMEDWEKIASDMGFVDSTFGLPDVRLAFVHCRMLVSDVGNNWEKYTSMTFIDFLEALGYVADNKFLPDEKMLKAANFENTFDWQRHTEQGGEEAYNVIPRRPSGTTGWVSEKKRPLGVKVQALLDLMFRRLFFDPHNPENEYTYDGCVALIKKIDKNLGP